MLSKPFSPPSPLQTRTHHLPEKQLLLDQDSARSYSQWKHKDAPTYVTERVYHHRRRRARHEPCQGSSVAQAIEDATVRRTLLDGVYDEVRRAAVRLSRSFPCILLAYGSFYGSFHPCLLDVSLLVLYPMAPTSRSSDAFYHSPLHPLRAADAADRRVE